MGFGPKCGGWKYKVGQVIIHALKPGGRVTLCGLKIGAGWKSVSKPKWGAKCSACKQALR